MRLVSPSSKARKSYLTRLACYQTLAGFYFQQRLLHHSWSKSGSSALISPRSSCKFRATLIRRSCRSWPTAPSFSPLPSREISPRNRSHYQTKPITCTLHSTPISSPRLSTAITSTPSSAGEPTRSSYARTAQNSTTKSTAKLTTPKTSATPGGTAKTSNPPSPSTTSAT